MGIKEIDVWLDVGRSGRCFTYKDENGLGVGVGDIVLVPLKGRAMHGLVVRVDSALGDLKANIDNQNKNA